jgi:type IV pilus assembly protein PilA
MITLRKKENQKERNMITLNKKEKGFTLVELMVVIIIVGILAAVAIPKFLDASHKAKASEFPTQLTALYTGENAYSAERGSYVTDFGMLRDSAGVDIQSSSKWFNYVVTVANGGSTFTGTATAQSNFGTVTSGTDKGYINEANVKTCTGPLFRYCPNWR